MILVHYARHSDGVSFFFFNDTATTEIYTLSLHDALPILCQFVHGDERELEREEGQLDDDQRLGEEHVLVPGGEGGVGRSEEHTSELQSRQYLVCRLLLEKKKKKYAAIFIPCKKVASPSLR